ncbi:hypothetical protein ISN45_At03g002890 [Arabidopsis thaliana x Arabidopsis arenosa]|uniref:Uncharacterized protein n=2 Tax=Arabidopsis TaxID=3701 RepID=A0A8T2F7B4_ARASU|nr:hypothetical protein ISN45_At03g002890 [Arabidopsis thaliana x Arabidopsis arenosa]KAG7629883.1 hypothetical protein ISN44_As03g002820 [Arabidopsis suecica]
MKVTLCCGRLVGYVFLYVAHEKLLMCPPQILEL